MVNAKQKVQSAASQVHDNTPSTVRFSDILQEYNYYGNWHTLKMTADAYVNMFNYSMVLRDSGSRTISLSK